MKLPPANLPPLPEGHVYLGRGTTFRVPSTGFRGYTLRGPDDGWVYFEYLSGDSIGLDYCAPADSEVVKLNTPRVEPKALHIVWCAQRGEPTKTHPSFESAETEAKRLAAKHPGNTYHICEVVAAYVGEVTVKKV